MLTFNHLPRNKATDGRNGGGGWRRNDGYCVSRGEVVTLYDGRKRMKAEGLSEGCLSDIASYDNGIQAKISI